MKKWTFVFLFYIVLTMATFAGEREFEIPLQKWSDITVGDRQIRLAIYDNGIDYISLKIVGYEIRQVKKILGTDTNKDNRSLIFSNGKQALYYANSPDSRAGNCKLVLVTQ